LKSYRLMQAYTQTDYVWLDMPRTHERGKKD